MSQERFKAEILPIRQKLFHIAQHILVEEEEAEDAVQEVLLKLWRTRDSLDKYDDLVKENFELKVRGERYEETIKHLQN